MLSFMSIFLSQHRWVTYYYYQPKLGQLKSVYTGRDKATVENHLKFVSIPHKKNAAAVYCQGLSCHASSSVHSITDYNEFYSILSRCSRPVRFYDKARSRTRVNIGSAFQRWREFKEREGLRSDAEVALFLPDR